MTSEWLDCGVPFAVAMEMWKLHQRDWTQREIADLLGVRIDSVSRALRLLEGHRVVRRAPVPSGPHSYGRARFVYRWSGGPIGGHA